MAFVPFVESDQPTMAAFNEKFQQNYEAAIAAAGKVESGTYKGPGSGNGVTINFSFKPKIVFIVAESTRYPYSGLICIYGNPYAPHYHNSSTGYVVSLVWGEKSLSFGSDNWNKSDFTYHYVAIG